MMKKYVFLVTCMMLTHFSAAQGLSGFPSGASIPTADEIKVHVTDKKFSAVRSDGRGLRFEYQSSGKFNVMLGSFSEHGTWTAEEGKICVQDPKNGPACNEVRIHNGALFYKRISNGEVFELKPL